MTPLDPRPCATCGKPQMERFRPFCSRRCADVDLHRWLSGVYAVPVVEDEDEDGERPPEGGEAGGRDGGQQGDGRG
jgi:endogenous inhibitor of DNA gyrase (YacG/DUF329 family)